MKNTHIKDKFDILGIFASLACALHCSILPLSIASGLLSSTFMKGHGLVEWLFISLSIIFAFNSLLKSYRNIHKNLSPLTFFASGMTMVIIGLYFHGMAEIILATTGGLIITTAHVTNIKLNKETTLLVNPS